MSGERASAPASSPRPASKTGKPTSGEQWHRIERAHANRSGKTFRVSERPRIELCPTCHRPLIRGLDAIALAVDVRLDPVPLGPLGEAAVLWTGGRTWSVTVRAMSTLVIADRDPYTIARRPAGSRPDQNVYPGHRCAFAWTDPRYLAEDRLPKVRGGLFVLPLEPPF